MAPWFKSLQHFSLFFLFYWRNKTRIVKVGAIYRHFKGDYVYVIGVAKHSESIEDLVIYSHKNKLWARPVNMFLSEVDHEKYPDVKQCYRFEEVNHKNNRREEK